MTSRRNARRGEAVRPQGQGKVRRLEVRASHLYPGAGGALTGAEGALTGALGRLNIAVEADSLPGLEEGDYYWHQLQGLQVWGRELRKSVRKGEKSSEGEDDGTVPSLGEAQLDIHGE